MMPTAAAFMKSGLPGNGQAVLYGTIVSGIQPGRIPAACKPAAKAASCAASMAGP